MKVLATTYTKNSYSFTQVSREGNIAIYEQREPLNDRLLGYEVFIVQQNPERQIAGVKIPTSESTPGNEQWGTKGFTTHTLQQAKDKIPYLQDRIKGEGSRAQV